ncbi:MAG TPA: LptF/LptG family permease [Planctomycetota bacterium]|nr:LptF/LptG family permease [Planctomycetota bacterium]
MTLQLYLFRQIALSTLFAVGALGFIVFPAVAVSAVQKLGAAGLMAVLSYLPLVGIEIAPYLLSLGFLLAVVTTFGRLAADREWVAIQMSGLHPAWMVLPGLVVAGLLGGATWYAVSTVSPAWKLEQGNFRANVLTEAFRNLAPGRTEIDLGRFYVAAAARDGTAFVDAQIRIPKESGDDLTLVADRVEISFTDTELVVLLANARAVEQGDDFRIGLPTVRIPLDQIFTRSTRDLRRAKYNTSGALVEGLRAGSVPEQFRVEWVLEVHERYAMGATFVVFLLVGIPTGLWLRSGAQLTGLGFAALYAFAYFILSLQVGEGLARNGVLSPALAPWTTNILGGAFGLVFLWRSAAR